MSNKFEAMKAEMDGLDVWPDLLRYATEDTPVDQIPDDDLQRMKWYGVFHRPQTPGTSMMRLRLPGGRATSEQLRVIAGLAEAGTHPYLDVASRQNIQLRGFRLPDVPGMIEALPSAGVLCQQTGLDNVRNIMGCPSPVSTAARSSTQPIWSKHSSTPTSATAPTHEYRGPVRLVVPFLQGYKSVKWVGAHHAYRHDPIGIKRLLGQSKSGALGRAWLDKLGIAPAEGRAGDPAPDRP